MTFTCIECNNKHRLSAFRAGLIFANPGVKTTFGQSGKTFWLIVEDNATYVLKKDRLLFKHSGVEI